MTSLLRLSAGGESHGMLELSTTPVFEFEAQKHYIHGHFEAALAGEGLCNEYEPRYLHKPVLHTHCYRVCTSPQLYSATYPLFKLLHIYVQFLQWNVTPAPLAHHRNIGTVLYFTLGHVQNNWIVATRAGGRIEERP